MVPTMPPDSHKISLKIIEAIKNHPVLYISDVKGTAVKLQEFRQKVWKKISDELGLDPAWVRLRWKNLRDTYCRILKYKNRTDKGSRRKKWIFEDHLSFLKFPYEPDFRPQCVQLTEEYIEDINASGVSSETLLEQLEDRSDDDYSEYLEVLEETSADPVIQEDNQVVEMLECVSEDQLTTELEPSGELEYARDIENSYVKIRPKRMKLEPTEVTAEMVSGEALGNNSSINAIVIATGDLPSTSEEVEQAECTQQQENNHELNNSLHHELSLNNTNSSSGRETYAEELPKTSIELFFDSMAKTVRLLPPKAQAEVKMAVCRIVTEAEVKYSKCKNSQNVQKFIAPPGMIPKLVLIPCNMIDNPTGNK